MDYIYWRLKAGEAREAQRAWIRYCTEGVGSDNYVHDKSRRYVYI